MKAYQLYVKTEIPELKQEKETKNDRKNEFKYLQASVGINGNFLLRVDS